AEAGAQGVSNELVMVNGRGIEAEADWRNLKSPENYLSYTQGEGFASPGGVVRDRSHVYQLPDQLPLNGWALAGDWTTTKTASAANKPGGRIVYRFHARDVNLVMGPAAPGTSARFRVLIDGRAPGAAHGTDADEQGNGTVSEQRTYQLIRQS